MDKTEALCKVCGDKASGKHYGVSSCDGCRGFFKRSIRRGLAYHCKESGMCVVDVTRRNQCQACRFKKCLAVNMKRDAVQHERAPRSSTQPPHCTARRHSLQFGTHPAALFGASASVADLPAYHFIYPPPTFPFPLGFKPLSFFSCNAPLPPSTPLLALPGTTTSSVSARNSTIAEDEVTSSEEAAQLPGDKPKGNGKLGSSFLELPFIQGPETVYECAAKLLFLTVKWARSIPSFPQLSFQDQALLLEESWNDLFVLSAGEWMLPIDKDYLISQSLSVTIKREHLEREVYRLQDTITRLSSMRLDHTEFSCLKALTLFKPETRGLEQRGYVEQLQEQAHSSLQEHCTTPDTPRPRFGKLLLLLPSVHSLSKDLLEELLFRKTIGNISIERVLSDMLRSNSGQGALRDQVLMEFVRKMGKMCHKGAY